MIDFTQLAFEAALRGGLQPSLELLNATWDILVGEEVSRHTCPVAFEEGIITVAVRRDWITEWTRHQDTLLISIGRYIPGIRTLNFVEGEFEPNHYPSIPPVELATSDEVMDVERQLEETLARIAKLRSQEGDV